MRRIAVEEHFRLEMDELGKERLRDMFDAGIDVQVISLSTTPENTTFAKRANNELYKATKKYPERFVGLAALDVYDPDGSAYELERAVKELGFRGAKINTNMSRDYIDRRKYWVIFQKAVELDVPIYLHPSDPTGDFLKPFQDYPVLQRAVWGFGVVAGFQAIRLICSGIFDEYPRLKIILGHLGEALPFWIWRIDNSWRRRVESSESTPKIRKYPGQYIRDNFYITPSGFFDKTAFMCTYEKVGADRILFAVDYPFQPNKEAVQFMDSLPIPEEDKEKIYHLNSEKIFSL